MFEFFRLGGAGAQGRRGVGGLMDTHAREDGEVGFVAAGGQLGSVERGV